MSTLSVCIKRAGKALSGDDATAITTLRDELKADGMEPQAAAIEAVRQYMTELRAERTKLAEAMGAGAALFPIPAMANFDKQAIDAAAHEAATSPKNDLDQPTDAQIEAGNYKKGHITVQGLDITIENPKGSTRSGTRRDGSTWSNTMGSHYGYIKRTEGADGEQVDVYVGPSPESEAVFIIDQVKPDGTYDEHKVMIGYVDQAAAEAGYLENYDKGWKLGPVTPMSIAGFKEWLASGDTTKPMFALDSDPTPRQIEREGFTYLVSMADIQAATAGERAAFDTMAAERLRAGGYGQFAADAKFLDAAFKDAKKRHKEAELEKNRDPVIYQAKLAELTAAAELPEGEQEAFKLGFDHALAGRTKSTITGDSKLKGYEAARAWIKTPEGRAFYEGKRGNKLEDTGADLRRWFDQARDDADAAGGEWRMVLKALEKATARANLFRPDLEGATPGTARMAELIRARVNTFKEYYVLNSDIWKRKTESFETAAERYFDRADEAVIADLIAGLKRKAAEYIEHMRTISEGLGGAKTVMELAERLKATVYFENAAGRTEIKEPLRRMIDTSNMRDLLPERAESKWSKISEVLASENKETDGSTNRKTPLTRPRLDHVTRTGRKDYRQGKNVTPEDFKKTFGFADGKIFGGYVKANQDQDHLNYSYDAFMDLADTLGIRPIDISLGGSLYFTIGKLGHGKHAAHYSPNQPHPDGKMVPVINVTNTKGDGTVAHEWFHALDYAMRTTRGSQQQLGAVQRVVASLKAMHDTASIDKAVEQFIKGNWFYKGVGIAKDDRVGQARYAIERGTYGRATPTTFKKNADDLGEDYWGNNEELFARAGESYIFDTLAATANTYLVNDWVADGKTVPPAYRGTPYPMGEERARFNELFKALFETIEFTDKGPVFRETDRVGEIVDQRLKDFTEYKDAQLARLPALLRETKEATRGPAADTATDADRLIAEQKRREEQRLAMEAAEAEAQAQRPAEVTSDGALSEDELNALFDDASAELRESTQEQPDVPEPGQKPGSAGGETIFDNPPPGGWTDADKVPNSQRKPWNQDPKLPGYTPEPQSAGKLAAEAAKLGVKGIDEALTGLSKLFGGKNTLRSFPGGIDQDTYAQAKPHFQEALKAFVAAGKTIKDLFKFLIQNFGEGVKPYAVHFAREEGLGANLATSPGQADNQASEADNVPDRQAANTDDRAGDAGSGASNVRGPEGSGDAGGRDSGTGQGGEGFVPGGGRAGAEGGRDDQAETTAAGSDRGDDNATGNGSGNRPGPGNRVSERKRTGLNYLAAPGTLKREGSWRTTAERNLDVVELIKTLQAEGRQATAEEQAKLVKFTGWGASEIAQNLFPKYDNYARDEWKSLVERRAKLMSDSEKAAAARSTQYAHYTSEDVIRGIWTALEGMGFQGGTILEPGMGTGLFPAAAPEAVMAKSRYTGIEYDPFTAQIAQQLFQRENIIEGDYSKTKLPKDFFDVAIGNPPFGKVAIVNDPEYAKQSFPLHDYFFAKTIDRVRPGGIQVFVTSRYTMDKVNSRARKYLAERADLLGAIRLPNSAFKDNAGTEVVTDILFLRKRLPGEAPAGQAWLNAPAVNVEGTGVAVNEYFQKHPEMVLGKPSLAGSMYSKNEYTVLPGEQAIEQVLAEAIDRLPKGIYTPKTDAKTMVQESIERDFDPKSKKEGSLYVNDNGDLMRVESGSGVGLTSQLAKSLSAKDQAWLKDYVGLRDAVKQAQYDQLTEGEWESSLKALNKTYNAFLKKHGNILAFTKIERTQVDEETGETTSSSSYRWKNGNLLFLDVESPLVRMLEAITEDDQIIKGSFLNGRSIKKPERREINTIQDALLVSLDERGQLDLDFIAQLAGKERQAIVGELGDLIYEAPNGQWQMGDEYLSGDVVTKLEEAEAAAAVDDKYQRNVQALIKVQPKPLGPRNITVQLGAAWVPVETYEEFAAEELGIGASITHVPASNTWKIEGAGSRNARRNLSDYGTPDRSASEILEAALLGKDIKITKKDSDGKTYTDVTATAAANEKLKAMKEAFTRWVWTDAKRGERLAALYNRMFNNLAPRKFDGSHLTLPGLSLKYKIYEHQKRAIWRVMQTGNTYLAHAVGAGKTLEMVIAGMEMKRLGLISKPMYVVPKKMLTQFASEFLDAYPAANILVADDKNFDKANRGRFVAQAALNNPDAIIITHPAFTKLNVKDESRKRVADRFIGDLQYAIEQEKDRFRRKEMEAQLERLQRRFEAKAGKGTKDDVIDFEDLGVDFMFVDEAHEYRKLDFISRRGNIKGIDPNGSAMALDLFVKIQHLEQQRPGRSVVLASGTPIVNTMAELYSIMRMLNIGQLEADSLDHFDVWANQFGELRKDLEQNAAGQYEFVERFAEFVNVPALMKRVRNFMDVLTSSQLGDLVQRPDLEGNQPDLIITPASDRLTRYMKGELAQRIEAARAWKPSPGEPHNPDPLIAIISDGRLAGIDMRYVDPTLKDDPDSKLNRMLDEIIVKHKAIEKNKYYSDWDRESNLPRGPADVIQGGTQIVFSAVGFGAQVIKNRGFDVKAEIIKRLTAGGIQRNQIAFMDEYGTDAKKAQLFKDMRAGKVRVLFGSPKNMGTGLNVQKRLTTLHFLSPPWYPADVEQSHGRILRQGNQNPTVGIKWYATKGTYEGTMWRMIARKQAFIEGAFTGDDSVHKLEDVSESSQYEMASALSSGDQRAIQLAGLNADVERLTRLQNAHADDQVTYRGRKSASEFMLKQAREKLERYEAAYAAMGGDGAYVTEMSVESGDRALTDRNQAGDFIRSEMARVLAEWSVDGQTMEKANKAAPSVEIAKLQGKYPLMADGEAIPSLSGGIQKTINLTVILPEGIEQPVEQNNREPASIDAGGLYTRVRNKLNSVGTMIATEKNRETELADEIEKLTNRLGGRFQFETDLFEKKAEVERLKQELAADSAGAEAEAQRPMLYRDGRYDLGQGTIDARTGKWSGEGKWHITTLGAWPFRNVPAEGFPTKEAALAWVETLPLGNEGNFRVGGTQGRVSVADVQEVVDRIGGNWATKAAVVQTTADLPESAQVELKRQGITGEITGYYDRQNQAIYLVAGAMRSKMEAQVTLLHEGVGHLGIEKVMGPEINQFLKSVYEARGTDKAIKKAWDYVNRENTYGNAPRIVQAAEIVARLAESNPKHTMVQRFFQLVRQALRKMGFSVSFSNNDIIEALRRAKRALEDGTYAGEGSEGGLFQAAWHGSPHRHNKFTVEKIGTGEGNQAFGWGLYFAQNQNVAETYRTTLSNGHARRERLLADKLGNRPAITRDEIKQITDNLWFQSLTPYQSVEDVLDGRLTSGSLSPEAFDAAVEAASDAALNADDAGQMYRVELPENDELLDWNALLIDQPPAVKEALRSVPWAQDSSVWQHYTGEQLYESEVNVRVMMDGMTRGKAQESVSKELRAAGIPGHRYLDEFSRNSSPDVPEFTAWAGYYKGANLKTISGQELAELRAEYDEFVDAEDTRTRNFVIYDDERVSITDSLYSSTDPSYVNDGLFRVREKPAPKKTVTAYKLFRMKKGAPGKLFPLFVMANDPIQPNAWLDAEAGERTSTGQVKSKIGPLAFRPGWHTGDSPIATHIGLKEAKGDKAPSIRNPEHVWAEVEVGNDVDWQTEANKRAERYTTGPRAGQIRPVTAHITDQVPEDGYYRYKTNHSMLGNWIIAGTMKVKRLLSDAEVQELNTAKGYADLARKEPLDLEEWGFNADGSLPDGEWEQGSLFRARDPEPEQIDAGRREFLRKAGVATAFAITTAAGVQHRGTIADLKLGKATPISRAAEKNVDKATEKLLRDGDLKGALAAIGNTGPDELRALALQLADLVPETYGVFVDDDAQMNAHAQVTMNLAGYADMILYTQGDRHGLSYGTVLHETLHLAVMARYNSISSAASSNNWTLAGIAEPEGKAAMDAFVTLWQEFTNKVKESEGDPVGVSEALRSPDEFFVRALTDRPFQLQLAKLKYNGISLLDRFKHWVKFHLFGLKYSGTAPSWLDAAMLGAEDFIKSMGMDAADFGYANRLSELRSQREAQNSVLERGGQFRVDEDADPEEGAKRPLRAVLRDRLDAIRFEMQDKLIDLKRIQEEADPSDEANAYQKAAIWEGKAGERLHDFDEGAVQPLLAAISRTGLEWDEVGNWLVARHAEEANAYLAEINPDMDPDKRFRLSGMSNEQARGILERNANNANLWEVGELVDQINRDRVAMLVREGLITADMAGAWQGRYTHYVPLKREEAEGGDHLPARGQGFNIKGKESKMRTGSADWTPGKIVANVIAQYEASVVRAEKNKVGLALLKFVEQHPDDSFWNIDTERTMKYVRNGVVVEGPKGPDALHELSVKRDGVQHYISFNTDNPRAMRLVTGLKNLQAAEQGSVIRAMAAVTRFLATINTSWNPEFMVSNFARDVQTAAYNLSDTDISTMRGRVIKDIPAAMNGIRSALFGDGGAEWAPIWEDFRRQGGKTGWIDIHGDIKKQEQNLQKMAARLAEGKPSRGAVDRFLKGVENMNNVIENGVRLSAYKNALDAGLSKDKAAALAKDLTVNFNRKGNRGAIINAMYMFFNAAIQGNVRLIQAMANSKQGRNLALATVGFAVALDIINRSLAGDDDDGEDIYDTLPDHVKDRNIIIMGEKEPIVKIPAPWGYNVLHTIGQVIGQAMTGERFSPLEGASRVGMAIMGAFNPMGSGTVAQMLSPTITDPIVQIAENKNFAGLPLKPEHTFDSRAPAPEYTMHWSTAREASQAIAKFLNDASGGNTVRPGKINLSPEWIDLIVDTVTGGVGMTAANILDTATRLVSGQEFETENIPFVRKVTGFNNENGIKGRYYEWSRGVAYAQIEAKGLRGEELAAARRNPEYAMIGMYKATEKQLVGMRKMRREMVARGASEENIARLDERIRAVMARFNEAYAARVLK